MNSLTSRICTESRNIFSYCILILHQRNCTCIKKVIQMYVALLENAKDRDGGPKRSLVLLVNWTEDRYRLSYFTEDRGLINQSN